MGPDEIYHTVMNKNNDGRPSMHLINNFLSGLGSSNGLTEVIKNLGLGMRKKYEISENAELMTALEKQLYNKEYSTFEILFNENCKYGDFSMVSKVIMRNLQLITHVPQLERVF